MASGGVVAESESAPSMVDDEGRADCGGGTAESSDSKDSKKSRKFKPFEAMKKLFKGGRKRTKSKDENPISVVSVKAKSTTALTSAGSLDDDDDDDSDGGFKSHQSKQKLQGGKRSISEDSVFNPGDRTDTSLSALKTVTVSEENIHKNAFQNELFSKLKKRHSQYSDEDDGLPQSPVSSVTTADIIMSGSLKPHPVKSSSRESEKSLISVDSSDNEADDPFLSKWSSPGKPRPRSSDQSPPPDKSIRMDFEAVQPTQALSNEAAKHKRSVKPARKAHRQSRKKKENITAHGLPSLNEESPTKLQGDDEVFTRAGGSVAATADTSILTVSSKPETSEKPVVSMVTSAPAPKNSVALAKQKSDVQVKSSTDEASKLSSEGAAKAPVETGSKLSSATHPGTVKVEVKKDQAPVPPSKPVTTTDHDSSRARSTSVHLREKEESSVEKSTELSQALNKLKRTSAKVEPEDLPKDIGKIGSDKSEADKTKVSEDKSVTVISGDPSISSGHVDKSKLGVQKPAEEPKSLVKKPEESKTAPKHAEDTKSAAGITVVEKPTDKQISKTVVSSGKDIKQTINKQLSDESKKDDSDAKSDTSSVKSESFRKEGGFRVGSGSSATKEDYKLKRQSRSKTLPGQPQLPDEYSAKVQRAKSQRAESSPVAPAATSGQRQTAYDPIPTTKKIDTKRFSLDTTPASGQPEWMAAIKKRKAAENADTKNQVPEVKKDVMSTSAKDIVIKENEKPADRMTRSFTASSSTSSSLLDSSSKPDGKKPETFSINTSRATSVKTKAESKPEGGPVRFGSVKTPTKPVNIVTPSSSPVKPVSTTQPSSTTNSYSGTSSISKPYTSTTSSTKPDSIKQFGSGFKEPSKDTPKISPTEEGKKVFSRGQSVKTVSSSSESTSLPSRTGSVKSSSSVKTTASVTAKGPVQSDSSSEKSQKDSVPAWRSGLAKQPGTVHIEIIEKEPKQEVTLRKKPTPAPTPDSDTCRDTSSNRSSKVLDMVKNFQKLQVS